MSDNLLTRKYPNLNHVGVVVRDIDQAERDNSNRFGLSAIARRFTLHIENALYQGKTVSFSAEFGFVELGNTMLELIQPLGNDLSPYLDALQERGGGANTHHLEPIWCHPLMNTWRWHANQTPLSLSYLTPSCLIGWVAMC